MKHFLTPVAVVLLCAVVASIASESSHVVVLTDENFDEQTSKGKWLIEFYAPWCGHCKRLNPILDEASILISKGNYDIKIGKVDCTTETKLGDKYEIKGYPTLKYFRSGVTTPYEGGRSLESIMDFVKKATGPAVKDVTESTIDQFTKDNQVAFLLVGGSEIASEVFKSVASKLQESVAFAKAPASLKSKFGNKQDPFIVLLNDDEPVTYEGAFKEEDLTTWVIANRHPLFPELGSHNFHSIANNGKQTVVVTIDQADARTSKYLEMMRELSKIMKNEFSFGFLSGVEFQGFVEKHGVKELPNFFVLDAPSQTFWDTSSLTRPHTIESVQKFLQDVHSGKVEPHSASPMGTALRFVQNNLVMVLAGAVTLVVSIVFCCIYLSGSDDEQVPPPKRSAAAASSVKQD